MESLDLMAPPLHGEKSENYTTEPFRLKYLGLVRLAYSYYYTGIDAEGTIIEYLAMEERTGCGPVVFIYGWELAFKVLTDQEKAKSYLLKCLEFNPKSYEQDRLRFGI